MAESLKDRVAFGARNLLRSRGVEVSKAKGATTHGGHLAELFRRHHVDLVLDVGARFGEFGVFLRRNGYEGRIVSFEPVSGNVARLARCCGMDALWAFEQVALGAEDGTADINVMEMSSFSSFRRPSEFAVERFGHMIDIARVETVPVRRLDAMWPELVGEARSVFLKLDTQGWDLEVLAGAAGCLGSVIAVQTEMSLRAVYEDTPTWVQSVKALGDSGFEPSGFFPVVTEADGRMVEMDCVAVRCPG